MISVKDLHFSYELMGRNIELPSFHLMQGEQCLLLGKSGSGKTTLLHLLAGLIKPQSGDIFIAGTEMTKLKNAEIDAFRGKYIGLIFQKAHLISSLTVKENLYLAQYLAGIPKDKIRIEEILKELNLSSNVNSYVHQLSHGQAQRVTIGRALLNKPAIILADEPTSSLDDYNCEKVIELLQLQAEKHKATLIISTHDQRVKTKIKKQLNLDKVESL